MEEAKGMNWQWRKSASSFYFYLQKHSAVQETETVEGVSEPGLMKEMVNRAKAEERAEVKLATGQPKEQAEPTGEWNRGEKVAQMMIDAHVPAGNPPSFQYRREGLLKGHLPAAVFMHAFILFFKRYQYQK